MSGCRARLAFGGGPDATGALRAHRPRAVVARGGAAPEGAYEARARAPSLPRQVRPSARRGVPATALPAGAGGLRPVLRVGHDARRGERVRLPRGRLRRLGVQLPDGAREDRLAPAGRGRARSARRPRGCAAGGPCACGGSGGVGSRVVCRPSPRRAPRLPRRRRRARPGRTRGRVARAVACRPLGQADDRTSTSTFPAAPVLGPYWCHKHRRTCRPVGEAAKFLRRYTDDTLARLRAFAELRPGPAGRRPARRRAHGRAAVAGATGSSPRRRTPA